MTGIDPRVPLVFGTADSAGSGDHLLRVDPVPGFAHASGCGCCASRAAVAQALGALFIRRARGEVHWFNRVMLIAANPESLLKALREDAFVAARYRFD